MIKELIIKIVLVLLILSPIILAQDILVSSTEKINSYKIEINSTAVIVTEKETITSEKKTVIYGKRPDQYREEGYICNGDISYRLDSTTGEIIQYNHTGVFERVKAFFGLSECQRAFKERIGEYEVEEALGVVYESNEENLNGREVIKKVVVPKQFANDEQFFQYEIFYYDILTNELVRRVNVRNYGKINFTQDYSIEINPIIEEAVIFNPFKSWESAEVVCVVDLKKVEEIGIELDRFLRNPDGSKKENWVMTLEEFNNWQKLLSHLYDASCNTYSDSISYDEYIKRINEFSSYR